MISPGAWPQVQALFHAAHDASPEERERLLSGDSHDPAILAYVKQLLAAQDRVGDALEVPAIAALRDRPSAWETTPSLVGRRLGPYSVTRRIGQGGMGAVYEAERADGQVTQRVAVKTIWRGADSAILVQRFRTERQILAGLRHPNIAQFLDAGATEEGTPYLVMEFVDGRPIDEHCDQERLGLAARLHLFLQVCAAVQHAHRNLVVHRDIKPSNVLVTAEGAVRLLDFGVAKLLDDPRMEGTLTGAGLSPFTTAFASPEQVAGTPVSTATDVYSLGAVLTVLLTGRAPLDMSGQSPAEAMATIRATPATAPSELVAGDSLGGDDIARLRAFPNARQLSRALAHDLDAIVLMALRKEPSRRYATVDALAGDVNRHLRRDRVLARPDTLAYRVRTFARRQRALVIGTAVAAASLLAGTAVSLSQARASRIAAERSERLARFLSRVATQDATTIDPIARLGSRGTVAQLLDSLVSRIPATFSDDEGVRARLYTSIGANYTAQGRLGDAEAVLDSAVLLARRSYGARSDAFAAASLEMARAISNRTSPAESERHVQAALTALAGRERENPELYAKALIGLATVRHMRGEVRHADSLARAVVALEAARSSRPTTTRAIAVATLGQTTAWLRRDPRLVDSIYAHAIAISDSLDAPLAQERLYAIGERSEALVTLGRYDRADSLVVVGLDAARIGYGPRSRETAALLARRSAIASARGDSASAAAWSDSAWSLAEGLADLPAPQVVDIGMARVSNHWEHGRNEAADSVATRMLARVERQRVPMATTYAAFFAGLASTNVGRWAEAEQRLRQALAALPRSGDLDSMIDRLRRPLARVLAQEGRKREADSLLTLVPPVTAAGRCQPGGDWRGCE